MKKPRIYTVKMAAVYPLYITKAEKKGRNKAEVDQVIQWLTGYTDVSFQTALDQDYDMEAFILNAPSLNPNRHLITGVICGYRVETIEDEMTQEIRYMDKLIDELAKGKSMDKILRQGA